MRNIKIGYLNLDSFREDGPLCGFSPHGSMEFDDPTVYFGMRSKALFMAIAQDPDDLDFELGALPDGRWALVHTQPIEEGTPYAYEVDE